MKGSGKRFPGAVEVAPVVFVKRLVIEISGDANAPPLVWSGYPSPPAPRWSDSSPLKWCNNLALEAYNPSHPNASSGWVALTADAPFAGLEHSIHIRDTALAVAAGVATTALISLPWEPVVTHFGIDGANGTVTAGIGFLRWYPQGTVAADAKLPGIAADITSATVVEAAAPTSADNTNKMGIVTRAPGMHKIRFTDITGTATTLSFVAHYARDHY